MSWLVRKAHKLVFNRRAVTRSDALYHARIHRGFMQVVMNDLMGFRGCPGHVTGDLFFIRPDRLCRFGECHKARCTRLQRGLRKIDGLCQHPRRSSGLETECLETEIPQGLGKLSGRRFPVGTARHDFITDHVQTGHIGTGGKNHRPCGKKGTVAEGYAADTVLCYIQFHAHALDHRQV